MPQKVVSFKGINRKINEFLADGECEELINLRPEAGGVCVVKPKDSIISGVWYTQVYEHSWGENENLIIVDDVGSVKWIGKDNSVKQVLCTFGSKDIDVSYAGNVLVIYRNETKEQYVFKFEDEAYETYNLTLKKITDAKISYGRSYFSSPANAVEAIDGSAASVNEAMHKAASGFNNKYTNGLCGAAVVGCTYELEDGSEIWSTAFAVANAAHAYLYSKPSYDYSTKTVTVTGTNDVKLELRFDGSSPKGIKKINVYSTRPVFPYEAVSVTNAEDVKIDELSLDSMNLDSQIMYYQGSVSTNGISAVLSLRFGDTLAGDRLMDVTAGCVERKGRSVSYNNRFHYFDSEVEHVIQAPTVSRAPSTYTSEVIKEWIAYVKFDDKWKLIDNIYKIVDGTALDIIYPMIGIEAIRFVNAEQDDYGNVSVGYNDLFEVSLKDSMAYNYSYAFGVLPKIVPVGDDWLDELAEDGQLWGKDKVYDKKILWKKETNSMSVSAQYNPFVFPVEYSYAFGGEIKDIVTSYIPISSTQIGQYPVTVFTTNGIYALEQGSGKTLYDSVTPIQPLEIDGRAVSTPYGTFFKSSKNVYLLSGRDVENVTYALNGSVEKGIRNSQPYKTLCLDSSAGLHDFNFAVSMVDFEKHIEEATLSYDKIHNELYINSGHNNYEYAYVLNIGTRQFHKVSRKYNVFQNGGRYAIEAFGAEERNIVDLLSESDAVQPMLMQSRPMALSALYSHIDRAVLFADADLTKEGQYLMLSVFASDNLYDWKCIISAQKKDTVLSHIRTNRAAKSYKYYVFVINGAVSTDTDMSGVIVDYTEVTRRLG